MGGQSPPRCTKYNSPPINGQCTNHCIAIDDGLLLCCFNAAIKGLSGYELNIQQGHTVIHALKYGI